jgi:glycosyltransferase involved in cell wall biosynthesis
MWTRLRPSLLKPWRGANEMVSAVVPVYNGSRHLRRCIENLLAQQTAHGFEIVVSDDGSTDASRDIVNGFRDSRVRSVFHDQVGRAQNRNLGAAQAKGDMLVFLDHDMLAAPDLLAKHVDRLSGLGDTGTVIGCVPTASTCRQHRVGRYLAAKWERRLDALARNPADPFLMQSGNFSIRREFFDRLSGFDAGLDKYGAEDTDFFLRARDSGAVFAYAADAVSEHHDEASFRALYEKAKEKRVSMAALRRKHGLEEPSKPEVPTRRMVDSVWRGFRSWRGSQGLLLATLPLLERLAPDRRVFFVYDSLLAGAATGGADT